MLQEVDLLRFYDCEPWPPFPWNGSKDQAVLSTLPLHLKKVQSHKDSDSLVSPSTSSASFIINETDGDSSKQKDSDSVVSPSTSSASFIVNETDGDSSKQKAKNHQRSEARRQLRRKKYRNNKKLRTRQFTEGPISMPMETREFKKYSSDLPIGPLEMDDNDSTTCDEAPQKMTPQKPKRCTGLDICTCTKPINLAPVLIPINETPPIQAVSSEGDDVVHTTQCSVHVQLARNERNDALRLAQLYRNRIEQLVTEKRDLRHSLEEQVEKTREFWRNHIMEGGTRAGRMVRAALFRKDKL